MRGARRPAASAMSVKWAWNGRPEGPGLAWAFTSREAIPCPSSCWAEAQRENKTNERRVIVITQSLSRHSHYGGDDSASKGRLGPEEEKGPRPRQLVGLCARFDHQFVAILLRFFLGRVLPGFRQ